MVMVDFTAKLSDSRCGDSLVQTDHMSFIIIRSHCYHIHYLVQPLISITHLFQHFDINLILYYKFYINFPDLVLVV